MILHRLGVLWLAVLVAFGGSSLLAQIVSVRAPDPLVPQQPPAGRVLARLNCSLGWPACGVSSVSGSTAAITLTQLANGSNFRFNQGPHGQAYLGWRMNLPADAGDVIYIHYHLTINAGFVGRGSGDVWGNKLIIVNDGDGPEGLRAIAIMQPMQREDLTDLGLWINQNISGGITATTPQLLPHGQRLAVKMKVQRSAQAQFAIWINNTNCAQPTATSGVFSYLPARLSSVSMGFYSNVGIAPTGNVGFSLENVTVSTACDPSFT